MASKNINYFYFLCIFCAVAAFLLFTRTPAHASETDEKIQTSAMNSYVFKTYLKDDNIEIQSKDGVATLMGTVSDDSHKSLAEETVTGLPGVTRVDNQIQVKGTTPEAKTDGWIAFKIKAALLFHRHVSAANTQVYVKGGVVTLQGEASSQAQKDLTGEYAKDVEGVVRVENSIHVVSTPTHETLTEDIDDASITAQVKMALLSKRSTSGIKTKIETRNGVVTVKGNAKNNAEKDLVTKTIEDINGVKNVTNTMQVQ